MQRKKRINDFVKNLSNEGFKNVFYGEGSSFIAFNIGTGNFRCGDFKSKKVLELPVNYITNYEWKWVERNAQKTANKYFFYISNVDYPMHEVFYYAEERQAEIEWAMIQAVYRECLSSLEYELDEAHEVNHVSELVSYDFFVSHASEDKDDFVRPLVHELQKLGLKVWYDEFTLEIGDSLRRCIDNGLGSAKYGIVVLSPAFFAKQWPQYELDALVNRSMEGEKVILPIWHGVQKKEVSKYSHSLADKFALSTSQSGVTEIASALLKIAHKSAN